MRKLLIGLAGMTAALLVSAPASAATNLVANGNFEQQLAGWSVIPGGDIAAATGTSYVAAGATGSAAALANTMAAFGGGQVRNRSSLISAAFSTVAGKVYRLVFDYAQFGGTPGQEVLDYGVFDDGANALLAGTKVPTAQNTGTNLDTIFRNYRNNYFVGSGDFAHVYFSISGQPTINTDGLLDNVVITAVPEASTWAMLILGMSGAGVALRRRRRSQLALAA